MTNNGACGADDVASARRAGRELRNKPGAVKIEKLARARCSARHRGNALARQPEQHPPRQIVGLVPGLAILGDHVVQDLVQISSRHTAIFREGRGPPRSPRADDLHGAGLGVREGQQAVGDRARDGRQRTGGAGDRPAIGRIVVVDPDAVEIDLDPVLKISAIAVEREAHRAGARRPGNAVGGPALAVGQCRDSWRGLAESGSEGQREQRGEGQLAEHGFHAPGSYAYLSPGQRTAG